MSLNSQLCKIPSNGLWSVAIVRFWKPSTNILALSSAQATASNSPSVGEYRLSDGVVKRDPANMSFHPSGQHVGAFVVSHSQYFWRMRYPMPSVPISL